MRILGCFLTLFVLMHAAAYAAPMAEDGVLDLRAMPLETSGPVDLDGDWHFYWSGFYSPEALPAAEPMSIRTPATWGSVSADIGNKGFGTYRLQVVLSQGDIGHTLGLYVPGIASAYDLYINGKKLASVGKIGASRETMQPGILPHPVYFSVERPELELVVQVSNFSQRKGGIWDQFRLGTAEQIVKEREHRMLFQTFIAAGLLLFGLYHIGFYWLRAESSTLYFGLANLSLFLRTVFTGDMLAYQLFPPFPWEWGVKIEYMSVFCGISFLILYFYYLYEANLRRATSRGLALFMIGISLPIVFLSANVYTEWMAAYQIILLALVLYMVYGLARAARHRYSGALANLIVGLIFLGTVLNDILYYNFILNTIDLVAFGLFLFVFTQMFMLVRKFVASYREVERLTHRLESVNENLEVMVSERTGALRKSNERLAQAEKARRDLLSNITHELGNPLTSILGYLHRLKEGASKHLAERHLEIVYQKARKLERLTDDLRQLAKLEQHQLSYRMRRWTLKDFLRELASVYDWNALDREVTVHWKVRDMDRYHVNVDMQRIEQVLSNLVSNALAHTGASDRITIDGRLFAWANVFAVSVRDSGIGIAGEDQAHLFERFYRVRPLENDTPEGSGLGLAIAKEIVEAHQGKIGVRSAYGAGSTFYFMIPVSEVEQR